MRKYWFTALMVLSLPMFTYATVLTFGPICGNSCGARILPVGYGGFTWNNSFWAINNGYYDGAWGNTYGAPSGAAAYNGPGSSPITMNSATPFYFDGADFSTFAGNDAYSSMSSVTLTISAYDASSSFI